MFQQLEMQAQKGSDQSGTGHKARLAELARPLVSEIPAGVYRTLVEEQLHNKVGVKIFQTEKPAVNSYQPKKHEPAQGPSPVRKALIAILDTPSVVLDVDPEAYEFSSNIPGAALLLEIVSVIESTPDITTSGILERYRDTDQSQALHKLANAGMETTVETGIETPLSVLQNAIEQLNKESLSLRLQQETGSLNPSELTDEQKNQVRKHLQQLQQKKQ